MQDYTRLNLSNILGDSDTNIYISITGSGYRDTLTI